MDNLSDAYDPMLKEWRLGQFVGQPGFQFERLDITDFFALKSVFEKYGADQTPPFAGIVNLAARAGVRPLAWCRRSDQSPNQRRGEMPL